MIKNWRLTTDVTVMIKIDGSERLVYLTPPEKKYETSVSKLIDGYYSPITIENKFISLNIETDNESGDLKLYMSSPELPAEFKKYLVMNFDVSEIWKIIEHNNINSGKIDGEFYAVFSDKSLNKVSFVSKSMSEFTKCNDEMKRRINYEYFKKTKKIVPGHRYDSPKETRYYLCKVNSRKQNETHTQFLDDTLASGNELYLYVNNLKDTDTSISQILTSRCFGAGDYDIKVAYDSPSFVDSGCVLNNDFSGNIKDYWVPMFDNALKECTKKKPWGYVMYEDIKKLFDIFAYQNISDMSYKIDYNIINTLQEVLSTVLKHNLLVYWKVYNIDDTLVINDKNDFDKNMAALIKLFYKNFIDSNLYKELYYDVLLSNIGISLSSIARNVLISWDESMICSSFENFLMYKFYYNNKQFLFKYKIMNFVSNQRKSNNPDDESKDLNSISTILNKSELADVVIEIFEYANSNFGLGVNTYDIVNFGTKVRPDNAIYCIITLEDIINYKKGIENMSENLKNEIMRYKFNSIEVVVDKSEKVK